MLERGREGAARQKCSFFYLQLMMSRAGSSSTSSLNRPGFGHWLGPGLGLGLRLQFLLTVVLVVDQIYFSAIENWVIFFFIVLIISCLDNLSRCYQQSSTSSLELSGGSCPYYILVGGEAGPAVKYVMTSFSGEQPSSQWRSLWWSSPPPPEQLRSRSQLPVRKHQFFFRELCFYFDDVLFFI